MQLRVSGMISNSPYILLLDCDMYCNDPSSARQAMCCHLDPKLSPSLAFVQFPQKFHNLSSNDIYDSRMRSAFTVCTLLELTPLLTPRLWFKVAVSITESNTVECFYSNSDGMGRHGRT